MRIILLSVGLAQQWELLMVPLRIMHRSFARTQAQEPCVTPYGGFARLGQRYGAVNSSVGLVLVSYMTLASW
jgi:hypothetical protein